MNEIARKWLKRLFYDRWFRLLVVVGALGLAGLHSLISPWFQTSVSGRAEVVDGDSLRIGRHRVRLQGIDAPEQRQTCLRDGRSWDCGQAAQDYLAGLVRGHRVSCQVSDQDRFGRHLAHCHVGPLNLNRKMVGEGMAVAFGQTYRRDDQLARQQSLGIWGGQFVRPQIWRRDNPRQ